MEMFRLTQATENVIEDVKEKQMSVIEDVENKFPQTVDVEDAAAVAGSAIADVIAGIT